jgi:hypothetical protein
MAKLESGLYAPAIAMGILLSMPPAAGAQDVRPAPAVETWVGYATVEDNHALIGAGVRFYVSPRVSLSPRVTYAKTFGDNNHSDLYVEPALTFEFRRPMNGRPRFVSPFVLVTGGVSIQRFQGQTDVRSGCCGAIVGARVFLPLARGRVYVAPEVGYGPPITVSAPVTFGVPLRRP